jgi:fucose 4-O-acetylase-like acetyltransferase
MADMPSPVAPAVAPAITCTTAASTTADHLATATPATRNRVVDATRALAMMAVVFGHWLVAMPVRSATGGIGGVNALDTHRFFQYLTWLFQVMPLVFVVGGYANAASLAGARARGERDSDWVAARVRRLLKPTIVFAGFWAVMRLVLPNVGLVGAAAQVASVPLWFLAVYVVVVAAQPLIDRAWRRNRVATLGTLVLLSLVGDAAQLTPGFGGFARLNHLWVFAACQQFGVLWFEGRLPSGRRAAVRALGALSCAVTLVAFGPWPMSLVYVSGQRMSNAHPPTIILLLMGVVQLGVVRAVERHAAALLQRPRVWMAVAVVNLRMMTIYLWHFTALALASVAALSLGFEPGRNIGSTGWWLGRVPWFAVLAIVLGGLVWLLGRFESGGHASAHPVALVVIVPVVSWALFQITQFGAVALTALVLVGVDVGLAQTASRRAGHQLR